LIFNSVLPEISDFAMMPLQVFTMITCPLRCKWSSIFLSQAFILLAELPANRPAELFYGRKFLLPNGASSHNFAGAYQPVLAMNVIEKIEKEQCREDLTAFNVGDTVKVHTRVIEGDKERIQIYTGIVIGRKGTGINSSFTVRRVSYGEGVERVFPLHSPRIAKVEVERRGDVRRAKLNYLRGRKGKAATTVKEKAR
jgi:large subunit ribosomal protein L19